VRARGGQAEAFELGSSRERGVLCVHGFTGSPYEMRYLGEQLAARGWLAVGPALAGHVHGRPDELDATTWHDWYATAANAFDALRARVEHVAVAGLSMGGLLSLHLAAERGATIDALALLATPIWLPRPIEAAIRGLNGALGAVERWRGGALRVPHLPKKDGQSDVHDASARAQNPTMPGMPVRALGSLLDLQRVVRGELHRVYAPALVAHARRDHTAPFACAAAIAERLGSREMRGLTLERSYHVITIDEERELVARAVGEFFDEQFDQAAARGGR
jgi:carboxylesterase